MRVKKVREKSRECHNHKPQPFPYPKRKRKPTNPNKHKSNKRTKSTKISSLFPKRGNRNTKRTEKHKNKMTHGKTYNKSPRRINHKATKSKTKSCLNSNVLITHYTAINLTLFSSVLFFFWYFCFVLVLLNMYSPHHVNIHKHVILTPLNLTFI